jgi:catechol 2,3-dioxygenase-like lactoylglutathione lyase family enzyme
MLLACSHLVIATADVPRMTRFFSAAFGLEPHFANDLFAEFVLPSRFRVAFFAPVGKSARSFDAAADRSSCAFGVTVDDVEATYRTLSAMTAETPIALSGPPKEHPWGERSFLLTDPDGNRWEITQTPSGDGMLVDRT